MRPLSVTGFLAILIVGGVALDHIVVATVVLLLAGAFVLCYAIGKANR
jgi:hypothetical protein